jgi:hypothetical protein
LVHYISPTPFQCLALKKPVRWPGCGVGSNP